MLPHHLGLDVVINKGRLFHFAVNEAAVHQLGEGVGRAEHLQKSGFPVLNHPAVMGQGGLEFLRGEDPLLMGGDLGAGLDLLQALQGGLRGVQVRGRVPDRKSVV